MLRIEGIDKPLSRVVLGTMIVSAKTRDESFALLDAAYAAGINTFDCAHVYSGGDSERCIGLWLEARGLRERIVIVDKGCHPNADRPRVTPFDLAADLHDALARLRTDYIDMYLLHRDDLAVPVGTMVEAFNAHIAAGRIRTCGVSNWTIPRIQEAQAYAAAHGLTGFAGSSPNYGLADQVNDPWGRGCVTVSGPSHAADRAWYAQSGMAVFAYSSLARGLFSGRITRENYGEVADDACRKAYCHEVNFKRLDRAHHLAAQKGVTVTQIALAYVLTSSMRTYALVGAQNADEIAACVAAQHIPLTEVERRWLDAGDA